VYGSSSPSERFPGATWLASGRLGDRLAGARGAVAGQQPGPRAAGGTAGRLGVEAAVDRVVVLGGAGGAHREAGHGGVGPVVGHVPHDGEARPAVGAVGERVAVAAVAGVGQVGQAVGAGGGVGRDQRAALAAAPAGDDLEAGRPGRRHGHGGDPLDHRQRRRLPLEAGAERLDRDLGALHLHEDAVRVVADQAGEPQPGGQAVDERPEADALHNPLDPQLAPHPLPAHPCIVGRRVGHVHLPALSLRI
jgi:hypothetical protein